MYDSSRQANRGKDVSELFQAIGVNLTLRRRSRNRGYWGTSILGHV